MKTAESKSPCLERLFLYIFDKSTHIDYPLYVYLQLPTFLLRIFGRLTFLFPSKMIFSSFTTHVHKLQLLHFFLFDSLIRLILLQLQQHTGIRILTQDLGAEIQNLLAPNFHGGAGTQAVHRQFRILFLDAQQIVLVYKLDERRIDVRVRSRTSRRRSFPPRGFFRNVFVQAMQQLVQTIVTEPSGTCNARVCEK